MAENSSRMVGALESQETQINSCSIGQQCVTKTSNNENNIETNRTNTDDGSSLSSVNILQDAEDYVSMVMHSQQISAVLRTPLPSGRKRHLSLPAVGESEMKKLKSEDTKSLSDTSSFTTDDDEARDEDEIQNTDSTTKENKQRNTVRARRNLLKNRSNTANSPKTNKSKLKSSQQASNSRKTEKQLSNQSESSQKGKSKKKSDVKKGSAQTTEQKSVKSVKTVKENETITTATPTNVDTTAILKAMADLRSGLESKIDTWNRNSNEKFEMMKNEIDKVRKNFNDRIEGLAKKVEDRIIKTVAKDIDSKIKSAQAIIEKDIKNIKRNYESTEKKVAKLEETTLATMKEEIGDELDSLVNRVKNLESRTQDNASNTTVDSSEETRRRFIVRNLSERDNEDVKQRVNNVINDGLKLRITIETAVRKVNRINSKPGLIVATCKYTEDKDAIMKRKKDLKNSRRYENVFIENDIPPHQRKLNSNLRAIVNTLGQDKLYFKGSRVFTADDGNQTSDRRTVHDGFDAHDRRSYQFYDDRYQRDRARHRDSSSRDDYFKSSYRRDYRYRD